MKFIIILATLCVFASASPAVRYVEKRDGLNQFAIYYETDDGTVVEQHGRLIPGPEGNVMVMGGKTMYTGPDGKIYTTVWEGGPDGFKAEGDHIPKESSS